MDKSLPPRPNLDHLRRQAKSLLAALEKGDAAAVATFVEHLPAARGMNAAKVRAAKFRLADAQSAVARQTGFASWPRLSRHVEQLRALEGTWEFASLEVDGGAVPPGAIASSRLLIDGDRFRTESPEATYEGVFNIDVEAEPHAIDIEFIAGPEAGNTNRGIFRFEGEGLTICLDMNGKDRPAGFRTSPGSGHALETLRRASTTRPEAVTGGTAPPAAAPLPRHDGSGFEYAASPTLTRLQGEWVSEKLVMDGKEAPAMMAGAGRRVAKGNEVKVSFGGRVIIDARVRIDEGTSPMGVDYYHLSGAAKGSVQCGVMSWQGDVACFCMAAPGQPRPTDLTCEPGSGRTLSHWRKK